MKTIKEETLTAIGDAIREAEGTTELVPVVDMADRIKGVYDLGKKAQYDEYWDSVRYKMSDSSPYLFTGRFWSTTTFKPKYDILPKGNSSYYFYNNGFNGDVVQLCSELGIRFDTSQVTLASLMFCWAQFTRLGVIDSTNMTDIANLFNNCTNLVTIDKWIITERISFRNAFNNDTKLENLTIEGTIGQNGFDVQWSTKLSKASITSIINALSTTTSGLIITLSKTAVNKAFATNAEATNGSSSNEWISLIASRNNWTISLV